jgi:hypothetical protein
MLSDAWVASDLLEKRSDIFPSRPRLVATGDAINATNTNQTTLVYGDRWRIHRKLMVNISGSFPMAVEEADSVAHCCRLQAMRKYRDFQTHESAVLICDFLLEPHDFELSIERYSVSVTSIIGWGRRVDRKNDYVAQQALKLMEAVDFVVPGIYFIVDNTCLRGYMRCPVEFGWVPVCY